MASPNQQLQLPPPSDLHHGPPDSPPSPPDANNNQNPLHQFHHNFNNNNNNNNNHNIRLKSPTNSITTSSNTTATPTTPNTTTSHQMHVCGLCDKLLSSSSSLDRHMLTHSGERPFVCKRCHMTFTTNGNMHRHMRTHLHKDSIARQQQQQQQEQQLKSSAPPEPIHQVGPQLQLPLPLPAALASQAPLSPHLNINLAAAAAAAANNNTTAGPLAAPQLLNQMVNFQDLAGHIANRAATPAALVDVLNFRDPFLGAQTTTPATNGAGTQPPTGDLPQSSVSAFLNLLLVAASNFRQIKSTLVDASNQQQQLTPNHLSLNQPPTPNTMSMMDSPEPSGSELTNNQLDSPQPLGPLSIDSPQPTDSLSMMGSPPPLPTPQHHSTMYLDSPKQSASLSSSPMPCSPNPANMSAIMDSPMRHSSLLSVDSPQPGSLSMDSPQPITLSANPNTRLGPDQDDLAADISQSYVKTANPNAARKGGKRNRHCYKCKLCTYSSVDRCTLVRHLRIHSGERPYICGICRYAFTTKANCERHVRKRHKRQYNSLGGPGGGGIKGSNGGGRSLIITDHSNHQTIPVKVNPVAAQTISQTLQRIQGKQQQIPVNVEMNNIERLSKMQNGEGTQKARKQQWFAQQIINQQSLYQGDAIDLAAEALDLSCKFQSSK